MSTAPPDKKQQIQAGNKKCARIKYFGYSHDWDDCQKFGDLNWNVVYFHPISGAKGSLRRAFYACVYCIAMWFQSLKSQNVAFSWNRKVSIENSKPSVLSFEPS